MFDSNGKLKSLPNLLFPVMPAEMIHIEILGMDTIK